MPQKIDESQLSIYRVLADKLRSELANSPPDEGDIFYILDMFLFSFDAEKAAHIGNLNRKFTASMLKILCDIDNYVGHGIFRALKLLWFGPSILSQLIEHSNEMRSDLEKCTKLMHYIKCIHFVHFVEHCGANFTTPVIKKWMEVRSFKISEDDWQKLLAKELIQPPNL